jgi:alpha-glucosidase (family GH31 glycosyl hydrolase)
LLAGLAATVGLVGCSTTAVTTSQRVSLSSAVVAPAPTPAAGSAALSGAATAIPTTSPSPVAVQAGGFVVVIHLQPWGIEARDGGRLLFREAAGTAGNSPYGTSSYQRSGSSAWQHLLALERLEAVPGGQRCFVRTTEGGAGTATVEVTAQGEGVIRVAFQPPQGATVARTAVAATADEAETLLGLGERFDGLALAGRQFDLWAADRREVKYGSSTYLPVPWVVSNRGYGFLLDDTRRSSWEMRTQRRDAWLVSVPGPALAYYLVAGTPAQALERYTALTGRPPMPPPWGVGVVKTLVGGEQRVLADAARLKDASVPVDGIFVYDATDDAANVGWPGLPFDAIPPGQYPDVRRLTDGLRKLGYRPLGYFSSDFRPERKSYGQAAGQGFLVRGANGKPWLSPLYKISLLDATNPEAVRWWQQVPLKRALVDLGFDGGMFDLGEAVPIDAQFSGGRSGATVHNAFPVALGQALDGALQLWKPDGMFWMRSGYTGGQHFARSTWSGDPVQSWQPVTGIPSMLPAALGAGLAGYAYWHTEVGGFVDAGLDAASDRELYLRWLQLGAFTTLLRDNYGDRRGHPTDIWTDAETLGLWRRYARIHQALGPYLRQAARQAQQTGLPLLRHLALAYPDDPRAWIEQGQYLLGDDLLIAPVVQQGARSKAVYLPAGTWRDWWTGTQYQGPGEVTVPAPHDRIPVFVRGGAPPPLPAAASFLG